VPHNKTLYVNGKPTTLFRFRAQRFWAILTLGYSDQPTFQLSVPLSFYDAKCGSIRTGGQLVSWEKPSNENP
jgi:hypothetical protein